MNTEASLAVSLFVLSTGMSLLLKRTGVEECSHGNNYDKIVTVSAPGKVLIAGGYLVLEQSNTGVTIATTSRFYTTICCRETPTQGIDRLHITVTSPQFRTTYRYLYTPGSDVLSNEDALTNAFVERCLVLTFAFLREHMTAELFQSRISELAKHGVLSIKLRADNDFYSQSKELKRRNLPLLSSSLRRLKKFAPCPADPATGEVEVAKTGLGSSAALTTSLVGALLQWFGVVRLGMRIADGDRRIVHNLAQLVHANAQGKIGSGFDVAAAVYGTQTYQRFADSSFGHCLEEEVPSGALYRAVMDTTGAWNQTVGAFSVPPGIVMVLGDVCGGSSSSSMAREVLRWRKDKPAEADELWSDLGKRNVDIARTFRKLNQLHDAGPSGYNSSVAWASTTAREEWTAKTDDAVVATLVELAEHFAAARRQLKRMGELAGVDIEPDAQTELADATQSVEGVICALVPGAGGVDALVALALSDAARDRVEALWSQWESSAAGRASVCPLLLRAESGMLTGVAAHSDVAWD